MSEQLAALRGVEKNYPGFVLGPITLEVPAGSIVGLVGENGAGKTTLLKLLCGVNPPGKGEVMLLGGTPQDAAARADLGVVFEDAGFYESMNAAQVGSSMAGIFGARWDAALYAGYLKRFGLDAKKRIKEYSRGMNMKLKLAMALAHRPRLLVLDEATSGLDPVMRGELLELFLEFIQDEQHGILLSSHISADLEQVADSIAYLHGGKLLFHQNKDALLEQYGLLRCGEEALAQVPAALRVYTRRGLYGTETLVTDRAAVRLLLPQAVCDPAGIDDIMRYYSGRDAQ